MVDNPNPYPSAYDLLQILASPSHLLVLLPSPDRRALSPPPVSDLVSSLVSFVTALIDLSPSMGDCPYTPPPLSHLLWRGDGPLASLTARTAAATPGVDMERAEYLAAMRGLFGPEAGPPEDDEKVVKQQLNATCKEGKTPLVSGVVSGSSDSDSGGSVADGGSGGGGVGDGKRSGLKVEAETGDGAGTGTEEEKVSWSGSGTPSPQSLLENGLAREGGGGKGREHNGKGRKSGESGEKQENGGRDMLPRKKSWETPAEARDRLRFRLSIASRRMDVVAAAAAMTMKAESNKGEPWAARMNRTARAAGVCAIHGKALQPEEAAAGGKKGVTW